MNGRLAARALLLLVVLSGCSAAPASPPTGSPASPGSPPPSAVASPWDQEIAKVGPDGRRSLQSALKLMAMAFGPIPGVDAPTAAAGTVDSASPAVRVIRGHLDELTAEQRAAVDRYLTPPADSKVLEVPPAGTSSLPLPDTLAIIHPLFAEGPGYTDIEQETLDEGQRSGLRLPRTSGTSRYCGSA